MKTLTNRIRSLEKQAHVTLDDVLNKATQEVGELVEAILAGDVVETRKEAADELANVLSASDAVLQASRDCGDSGVPRERLRRPEAEDRNE